MLSLFGNNGVVIFDTSNVIGRALAVSKSIEDFAYKFSSMLLTYRNTFIGRDFVFAFEGKGKELRRKIYNNYKANRTNATKDFLDALSKVKEILSCCDCQTIIAPNGEADDAIASFVFTHRSFDAIIVSNDKDLWQLISDNTKVFTNIRGNNTLIDTFKCKHFLGIPPEKIVFYKAICGDKSDSIPSAVKGIKKSDIQQLVCMLDNIHDLPQILAHCDNLSVKSKNKLISAFDTISRNIDLVSLRIDDQLEYTTHTADYNKLLNTVPTLSLDIARRIVKG